MSDTEFDVVIAAYLIPDLAQKEFDALVKLVEDEQLEVEGVALVTVGTFLLGQSAQAQTDGTWISNFSGSWDNPVNWSGGNIADGAGSTANFNFDVVGGGLGITNNVNVSLDITSRTIGIVNIGDLDGTNGYTISTSGGFSLIFDNGGSNAQLNQTSGSFGDLIAVGVILNSSLDITNASSSNALTISGAIGLANWPISSGNNRGSGIESAAPITFAIAKVMAIAVAMTSSQ